MKQYLLSVYQPDGDPPTGDGLAEIMRDVRAVGDDLRSSPCYQWPRWTTSARARRLGWRITASGRSAG